MVEQDGADCHRRKEGKVASKEVETLTMTLRIAQEVVVPKTLFVKPVYIYIYMIMFSIRVY